MNETALLEEYKALSEEIQPALDRMAEIEGFFRRKRTGKYGDGAVRVSPNTRFNEALAYELLSARSLRRVTVTRIDSKLVKKHFPGIYRKARNKFDHRVTIDLDAIGVEQFADTHLEVVAS